MVQLLRKGAVICLGLRQLIDGGFSIDNVAAIPSKALLVTEPLSYRSPIYDRREDHLYKLAADPAGMMYTATATARKNNLKLYHEAMASQANPLPYTYENQVYSNGLSSNRPPFTFNTQNWESAAKERLSDEAYGYLWGSAGTRETEDNNRAEFKKWGILPSRLVPDPVTSLKTNLFGEEYDFPIAIAPVGVQQLFHRDGEIATATAARKESVTYILSTASCTSTEKVAEANGGGSRWYQLYWPDNEHNNITASLLNRAKQNGYKVLVVTLDTFVLGWRPSDLDHAFNPFLRPDHIGVELGLSDPVYHKYYEEKFGKPVEADLSPAIAEWVRILFSGISHSWEDLKFLQQHWDGPIILKGIQTIADAQRAVAAGVQGIVVLNHGGRQQDGVVSTLAVLPEIVEAVGDRLEILFDSGIRSGADIAKALALGAKMVLIGRPYVYGLALGGEEGVRHVLRSLLGELQLTLHLSGIKSVSQKDLNRSVVRRTGF
ncbi:hypothetical protein OIDMADRAFT_21862 [Oidiodendron maius Zn]|uniref:FMN hydroxy acid dehydrogenase domain-containing protein n=1 Tax=Oidiodendron maius (strain Zn) TaxID=913774 RepID=A0A0C3D6H5_OIDMZ|nr:hypothetical protein OIDMADRAFT_21862 [Oidiodendron maius Zn]